MVLRSRTNSIPVKSKNLPLTHKSIAETTKKKRELQSLISKNSSLFFFACIFLLGIAAGSLVGGFTRGTILEKLDFLFHASFLSRSADAYSTVFISSFASSFLFALAFLLLALSVWGFLCTPFLLFFSWIWFRAYGRISVYILWLEGFFILLSYNFAGGRSLWNCPFAGC